MNDNAEWPSYYPPGVPPEKAIDAAGRAFRIVRTIPPTSVDFRPTYEDWMAQKKVIPSDKLWQACGTSVHTDLAASRATRQRFRPLRDRRIVLGDLSPQHGKMMETGERAHLTVWFRAGAKPEADFMTDAEQAQ